MKTLLQDLRVTARTMAKRPMFALVAVSTLALGIGANTAVFSVLDRVVLNPLPYDQPEELVQFRHFFGGRGPGRYFSAPAFLDFREGLESLEAVGAMYDYQDYGATLTGQGLPRRVSLLPVSSDFFHVYGVSPIVGRTFTREEEVVTANVAVVSHRFWISDLGGSGDVLGTIITLDGAPFEIIGVLPSTFLDVVGGDVDLWLPQDLTTPVPVSPITSTSWNQRGNHYLTLIGRLRDGASMAQAQAELDALHVRVAELYPSESEKTARLSSMQEEMVAGVRPALYVLMGASVLVLLLACVNLANLFQARNANRRKELALRAALGSGGSRLVQLLLMEALVVLTLGGLAGLALAHLGVQALVGLIPGSLPRAQEIRPDATLLLFSLGTAAVAGILFGLIPALRYRNPAAAGALRERMQDAGAGWKKKVLGNGLVVSQVTMALILLVGAGLLVRSFMSLQDVELGMDPTHVLTFQVQLPSVGFEDPLMRTAFHQELHQNLVTLPGVEAVGAISWLPSSGSYNSWGLRYRNQEGDIEGSGANFRVVEGDYFDALNIRLREGRLFEASDDVDAPRVAVVNRTLSETIFEGRPAIGEQFQAAGNQLWTIIGIVDDVAHTAQGDMLPKVYLPHAQYAADRNWPLIQVIETGTPRADLLGLVRQELEQVNPGLVVHDVRTMDQVMSMATARERLGFLLMGIFAVLALILAAVGIYGVLASSVAQRTREIGIRMALGAEKRAVRWGVLRQAGILVLAGTGMGLLGAWGLSRVMGSLLFGITATDPLTFAVAPLVLFAVAGLAMFIPARRATRVNPIEAIRYE